MYDSSKQCVSLSFFDVGGVPPPLHFFSFYKSIQHSCTEVQLLYMHNESDFHWFISEAILTFNVL